ncbi:MAG: formate dehydrogenase accessory sulfurtransferase FdhD [Desulfobacteraceae bacterium]|nr:formate dehydrogenase accessory sulfurtransferase FdhD [Desulfobacteraceae bacterium]
MTESISGEYTEYFGGKQNRQSRDLIVEEPLSIRVEGKPYSVVMRTPGDEIAHTAGFCLSEGIVEHPEDIADIGFCEQDQTNVATLTVTGKRRGSIERLLERKGFVSQTSCGICGKEIITDLLQVLTRATGNTVFEAEKIMACVESLSSSQPLHKKTRSAHAAAIFDREVNKMASAEDVGRHNALDKAIGKVFLDRRIKDACLGVMSSRLSYELVQKAGRAGLEMLVGISMPTSLAVNLADSVNMTLACAKNGRLMVFCGEGRINPGTHPGKPE